MVSNARVEFQAACTSPTATAARLAYNSTPPLLHALLLLCCSSAALLLSNCCWHHADYWLLPWQAGPPAHHISLTLMDMILPLLSFLPCASVLHSAHSTHKGQATTACEVRVSTCRPHARAEKIYQDQTECVELLCTGCCCCMQLWHGHNCYLTPCCPRPNCCSPDRSKGRLAPQELM